ncbi:MAG: phosphoglycerate dehydrogenase [Candidatus Omnitrophota bacterium]|nr:phosphoglycerate dehydrogenase [Candidatus Omnitrophota bacterium]
MKILISDPLSEEGIKILKEQKDFQVDIKTGMKPEELKAIIKDYDALIVRSATKVTKDIIDAATNLKAIGRAGVGLDNVDLEAATKRGIMVMNTPGGNTISTAEHAMSLIMAVSRSIPQANQSTKAGEWKRSKFMGYELYNKTLGIVGLGRIGKEVAKRAISFGMHIIAFDPFLSLEIAKQVGAEVVDFKELLTRADYITIHTPLSDETKSLIAEKEFAMMKKTAYIINCARGGIVNEAALAKALEEGKIAGCALDVYEKEPPEGTPLLKYPNCIMTPHLGASTEEAQVNVAIEIAEVVRDALTGKGIRNAANFPSIEASVYKILAPYIALTEKIGLLASQLVEGRINQADITYCGILAQQQNTQPLTMGFVKGLLTPIVQDAVNFINAIDLARERGIKVQESKSSTEEEFVNLVSVDLVTDKEKLQISGTLFSNNQPRIVKINDFYVEAIPQGYMLVAHNQDKPGIIGVLGTILGKNNINIAGMTFGRETAGGKAITVVNIDSPVPPSVLAEIKKAQHILDVKLIKL